MEDIKKYLELAQIEYVVEPTLTSNHYDICISTNKIIKAPILQMLINLVNAHHKFIRIENNQLIIY